MANYGLQQRFSSADVAEDAANVKDGYCVLPSEASEISWLKLL